MSGQARRPSPPTTNLVKVVDPVENASRSAYPKAGPSLQVNNSYQRHFMRKSDPTYIGDDSTMDLDRLRRFNLNPDDYEEVKIRK